MARVEHIGDASLYLGDCREIMPSLDAADLVFADPWYYADNRGTRNAFEGDYFWRTTEEWLVEIDRLCKATKGHAFISFSSQLAAKFEPNVRPAGNILATR